MKGIYQFQQCQQLLLESTRTIIGNESNLYHKLANKINMQIDTNDCIDPKAAGRIIRAAEEETLMNNHTIDHKIIDMNWPIECGAHEILNYFTLLK